MLVLSGKRITNRLLLNLWIPKKQAVAAAKPAGKARRRRRKKPTPKLWCRHGRALRRSSVVSIIRPDRAAGSANEKLINKFMNPQTKVYENGVLTTRFHQKRSKVGRFDSFKASVKRAVRKTLQAAVVVAVIAFAFAIGGAFYSTSTITVSANTIETPSPILDRIAFCESHGHQLNPSGQVLLNVNTNGTVDIGKYQINSIHEAEATKLGDDLFTLEGNTAYAKYIYANKGTGDWASSQKCWAR